MKTILTAWLLVAVAAAIGIITADASGFSYGTPDFGACFAFSTFIGLVGALIYCGIKSEKNQP